MLNGSVEQSNKRGANDAMDLNINVPTDNPTTPHFVKTNIPNLIKLEPMGSYYGRCKVHGKLVRQSLETKDFKVAKKKILQWLIDTRGRVNAHEGNMGNLAEEYLRRLQLAVDSRDIRDRTMATKIECLNHLQKTPVIPRRPAQISR